jgi:tetratricopeptide (TPR) repeat protein
MNKVMFIMAVMFIFLIAAFIALAEPIKFEKEYTYQASDIDSKVSSRAIALEQVKRALLEQLGTYLISETEVKNYQMTKDQITTLTAGIVSAEVIEEKWDGKTYYLKAKIVADPQEVAKSVDVLRRDVQKNKELEDSKKKAEAAMREVERLKKELELAKTDTRKQRDYANSANNLSAADWFDRGYAFIQSKNYMGALEAYNKAIELNPKEAMTYYNRGTTYAVLENYQQAINDYNNAIKLNPKFVSAYINRGNAYDALRNYQQAIRDFDKAIELYPQDAAAYHNRGFAYYHLGNEQQAIRDFNKAIELDPQNAVDYYNRGGAYGYLGNIQQAMKDFKLAAKLGDKQAQDLLSSEGIAW